MPSKIIQQIFAKSVEVPVAVVEAAVAAVGHQPAGGAELVVVVGLLGRVVPGRGDVPGNKPRTDSITKSCLK